MAVARHYNVQEVGSVLAQSEGRRPPGRTRGGHTLARHVYISNAGMLAKEHDDFLRRARADALRRLALFTWATAFLASGEGRDDAVHAATRLLNSADGQTSLAALDSGQVGGLVSWWGPVGASFKLRYSSGQVVRTAPGGHAAICVAALPGGDLHIHTCFPVLGASSQRELADELGSP